MRADYCWRHVHSVEAFLSLRRGDATPFALPGARPKYPRDRAFEPRHIHLDVQLDLEKKRLSGHATLLMACRAGEGRTVRLDARELEIEAVYVEGLHEPVAHHYDGATLSVELPEAISRGDTRSLVVRYATTGPRLGLYFIEPDAAHPDRPAHAWTQNQDDDAPYWFPCIDDPGVKFTLSVVAAAPEGLRVLSNGVQDGPPRPLAHLPGLSATTWHLDSPLPAYLVSLVVGPFHEHLEPEVEGLPLLAWYHLPGRAEDAQRAFGNTGDMVRFFQDYLRVPYVWPRYGQVAVSEFVFGGMENTTFTTVTDNVLFDERAALDYSADSLIAHELAHQWFGDLVTCREWAHAWLNEGFATYFDCLYQQHSKGQEEFDYELFDLARDYFDEDRTRFRRPVVARDYSEPVDLFDRHLYHKGAWVLHMLRAKLGEEGFRTGVRVWLERFRFQEAETHDFRRAMEDATGARLGQFFEQWIERGGYPTLSYTVITPPKGPSAVRIELKSNGGVFETEVLAVSGTNTLRIPVRIEDSPVSVVLTGLTAPTLVVVDPAYTLLGELSPDLAWGLLEAAVESPVISAARRIDMARALSKKGGPRALAALTKALDNDPFWGVRREVARILGELRTPASREVLTKRLPREAHPKVRRGLVQALGEFRDDPVAEAAVHVLAEGGDPSYFVEGDALTALAKTAGARALPTLLDGLGRPSFNDVIAAGALAGLGWIRTAESLAAVQGRLAPTYPTLVRVAAIAALGRLGREVPQNRRPVLESFEAIAGDAGYRVQIALIAALESLGGAEALPLLDRVDALGADGRVHRRAGEARRAIQRRLDGDGGLPAVRDDITRVRTEVAALRDRIDRVGQGGPG